MIFSALKYDKACVRLFLCGGGSVAGYVCRTARLRPPGFGATAFARFAMSSWKGLAEPKLAKLSGPIKCESLNPLIYRDTPKIRESNNQRIMSRSSPKTKIRESIAQMPTMLSSACRVAR
jgi:hypothetical protein